MKELDEKVKISMDLHIHSHYSDSPFSIDQLFKIATMQGLSYIAIADHDTIKGINDIKKAVKNYDLKAIPAIEISAYSFSLNKKVHILAYGYHKAMPHTEKLCNILLERRTRHSIMQIEMIRKQGYKLDLDEVKKIAQHSTAIYKQHIMKALIHNGYTQKVLSPLYDYFFKNNGICSKDMDYIDAHDVVKAVKLDGCMAVAAHPSKSSCLPVIEDLVKIGLDGLEISHPDQNESEQQMIRQLADQYNLILTGGSDFHGRYGNPPFMGCCLAPCPELFLEKLSSISGPQSILF